VFFAHSTPDGSQSDWQGLAAHLVAVSELAGRFAAPFQGAAAAKLAGLLHDLGKYTAAFQARLRGSTIPADHSTAGAVIVRQLAQGNDRLMAELISYAIAGHHAGLPDWRGETGALKDRLKAFDLGVLDPIWESEVAPVPTDLLPQIARQFRSYSGFRFAFLGRMLFSCLVDADYKDTEAFYNERERKAADREWVSLEQVLPDLQAKLDRKFASFTRDSDVNRLRGEILAHVLSRVSDEPGLFTLTVPTGGGKTLASLAFALAHARQKSKRRIIYAIPFTSIIDQTAKIFRDILGDEHVLEHHSAIDFEKFEGRTSRDKLRLAMEDWAAPVVVTTNVQLFESLFASRPSHCRKLHNIANSVIVLDEAQTLPRHLLAPCVRVIDELARSYGCTVILCTATQPALDERNFPEREDKVPHPLALPLKGRELAPDPLQLAKKLSRATLRFVGERNNDELVEELGETSQGLIIVNSRQHALELYEAAKTAGLKGLFHLTTRQCAVHRRAILDEVRARLRDGKSCRLVATSLIEAGVDVDFPRVWRAEAGLDQIAQAAGRCNREGTRAAKESIVSVFIAPGIAIPKEIRGLIGARERMERYHDDLLSPAAIEAYFKEVFWQQGENIGTSEFVDAFRFDRVQLKTDFPYRTIGESFRMIESAMRPVIIERDEKAEALIAKLALENVSSGSLARDLQGYIVQVPPKARELLVANGHVRFVAPNLRADQFAVLQTASLYDEEVGLRWDEAGYLAIENSIL
jgi:CRISPR-associated endonuclease/helicase Cas3